MVKINWLGDVVGRTGLKALLPVSRHRLGGQHHDGKGGERGHLPDRRGGLVPVQPRKHHVHQNKVDRQALLLEQPDRGVAVVRVQHLHSVHLQGARQREDIADVVVHDEHARSDQRVGLVEAAGHRRVAQISGQPGEERRVRYVGLRLTSKRPTRPCAR